MASNYSVYGAKFNPFTYEELATPIMQMTQDYRDMQDKYSALMAQAEAWQDKANEENNPYAHAIYTNYINDLKLAADDLSRTGLNEANRSKLLSFYPRYAKEIMPIENAYTKWNQVMEEHRKMQMQDPSFRASYGDTPPNIDMYLANPELQFNTTSGNTMRKEVSDRAKNFALHNPTVWREILDGRLLQGIQSGAYSVDDIYDIINGDEAARRENPELVNLVDTVVNEYMQGDWSDEDREWGWKYAAQGLYDALADREYNYYNNPGYTPGVPEEEPERVRREANLFSTPSGVYGNAEEYDYSKDYRYASPEEAEMIGLPIMLKDMRELSDEDKKVLNEYYSTKKDERLTSIYESLSDKYKNELEPILSYDQGILNLNTHLVDNKILNEFSQQDRTLLRGIPSNLGGMVYIMDDATVDKVLNNPEDYSDPVKAYALTQKISGIRSDALGKLSRKGKKIIKKELYDKVEKVIDDYSYLYPGDDNASRQKAFTFGITFEQDQAKQNTTRYLLSNEDTQKNKAKDFVGSIIKGIDKDQLNDRNNTEFGFFDEEGKKLKDVDLYKDDSDMWDSFDIYVSNKPGQEGFVFSINGKHYQLRGSNEIDEANQDMMMFNTIASDFSKGSIIGSNGNGKVIPGDDAIARHIEEELAYENGISNIDKGIQRKMTENLNPVLDDKGNETGYYKVVLHDTSEHGQGLPDNYYIYVFKRNARGGFDYLGKNNLYAEMYDGEERSEQLSLLANDLLTNLTRSSIREVE